MFLYVLCLKEIFGIGNAFLLINKDPEDRDDSLVIISDHLPIFNSKLFVDLLIYPIGKTNFICLYLFE